jgi:hypothetical protein
VVLPLLRFLLSILLVYIVIAPTGPGYAGFLADLLARMDPHFRRFVRAGIAHELRIEEIAWGGVVVDGVPALDHPAMIGASAASYLNPDEPVFGVEINGDARAYPLRIANWHEMVNDVVGGAPVSLAYCTLCGDRLQDRARGAAAVADLVVAVALAPLGDARLVARHRVPARLWPGRPLP